MDVVTKQEEMDIAADGVDPANLFKNQSKQTGH